VKITESTFALTLFDDRRQVAVARKKLNTGWLVTGYGVSWIDKGDSKNILGISSPELLPLKSITQVRKLFNDIA
jgi:hypothetical protein